MHQSVSFTLVLRDVSRFLCVFDEWRRSNGHTLFYTLSVNHWYLSTSLHVEQNSGGDDVQIFMPPQEGSGEAEVPATAQEVSDDTVLPSTPGIEEQFEPASADMFAGSVR